MMMAKGGVIRGPFIAGEAGREAVIPLTDPRFNVGGVIVLPGRGGTSSTGGMGTNVTVVFEGDSALLEDFIKVKAVEASGGIGDALGRRSEERRRGGRF